MFTEAEREGKYNIAYEVAFLLAMPESCVDILMKAKKYGEAAMFARSYIPSSIPAIMKEWTEQLKSSGLPFVPENIFESRQHKVVMSQAREIYAN